MKQMICVLVFLGLLVSATTGAVAQTGSGSGVGSGSGSAVPAADPAPAPPAPSTFQPDAADLRKICVSAMNGDKTFAESIIKQAKVMNCADSDVLKAHQDAQHHIQKNERQVIIAYAVMWAIAAAFVLFLWRKQLSLKSEIAQLRRDLDSAKDGK